MRYATSLRILHWIMAIIILGLVGLGWFMSDLPKDYPNRMFLYNLHKSLGVTVLFLVTLRVLLRLVKGAPKLPNAISKRDAMLAHLTHKVLYLLMFAVPAIGILLSNSWGYPVSWFGIELPMVFAKNFEVGKQAGELHEIAAYTLLAVAGLHLAGAIKHRYIDKHDILYRMTWLKVPGEKAQ